MQSMFHSYSGRIPSLGGIKHKRGKSGQIGQNQGLLTVTLEETEDMNQQMVENQDKLSNSQGKD